MTKRIALALAVICLVVASGACQCTRYQKSPERTVTVPGYSGGTTTIINGETGR